MSKQGYKRWFNTRFWNDSFVADLDPTEKLLFVYFLTNEHSNICGIYELPIKIIAIETGFEVSMIKKIFGRLKDKVRHVNGHVVVRNWLKHQSLTSIDTQTGILNCLKELDEIWLNSLVEKKLYHIPEKLAQGAYRVPVGVPTYSDSDTDTDSDKSSADAPIKKSVKYVSHAPDVIKAFEVVDPKNKNYYVNKTQRKAADFLVEEYGLENVLNIVKVLPETNKIIYFPSITNPHELQERWVKLGDAYAKEKKNKASKVGERLKNVIW